MQSLFFTTKFNLPSRPEKLKKQRTNSPETRAN